jgi:cytidylate kinase
MAPDAIAVDTTGHTLDEVIDRVVALVEATEERS